MARKYVHFLGYSAAEGGVVEIFTQDTMSLGSIDILTGEREFDDFEFTVPYSSIFEQNPENNESFYLSTPLYGGTIIQVSPSLNKFLISGARALTVGENLWIENERVGVLSDSYVVDGVTYYQISRGLNNSLPVSHFENTNYINESNVVILTKRLRIVGIIVKIYDSEGKIYGYGQVKECKITNSSAVTISCTNLYAQLDNEMILESPVGYNSIAGGIKFGYNEFFALLESPSFAIESYFKTEEVENSTQYVSVSNVKTAFEQVLYINDQILVFDSSKGHYSTKKMRRLVGTEAPVDLLLGKIVLTKGGVVESSTFNHISKCTIKGTDGLEQQISSFDINYTDATTGGEEITIDFSALTIEQLIDYSDIAKSKIDFLSNIIEKLEISVDRFSSNFTVGGFYRFLDIYKYKTFHTNIADNVFLCTGQDGVKVSFVRVLSYTSTLIAPALLMYKEAEFTLRLLNADEDLLSLYLETPTTELNVASNLITTSLFFAIDDEITLSDADGTVYRTTIGDIDSSRMYIADDVGATGTFFLVTIESGKAFSALQTKNKAYIYEGEGVL